MRYIPLFLIVFSASANDNASGISDEARYLQLISEENSLFKSAINIPEVKEIYSECFKTKQDQATKAVDASELSSCLWDGIQANQGALKKVNKLVEEQQGENGSARYRKTISAVKNASPGILALRKYFEDQLNEAFYGKYDSKTKKYEKLVEQSKFYELYKTQLGKNIITSLTSYCLDAKKVGDDIFLISESGKDTQRQTNINALNTSKIDNNGKPADAQKWESCITSIKNICYAGGSENNKSTTIDRETGASNHVSYIDLKKACEDKGDFKSSCTNILKYSNERACEVIEYTDASRKSMVLTEEIDTKLRDKFSNSSIRGTGHRMYGQSGSDKSVDQLTTITSGQALEALASDEGQKRELAEIKKCYDGNNIVDPKECEKYLNTDKEEQFKIIGEIKIQQEVTLKKLKEIDENDKDAVAKLLIEEGYTSEQAEMLALKNGVKAEIEKRYEAKKDAILSSLAKEMQDMTTTGEEFSAEADKGKIEKIYEKIEQRPKNFASLMHYNNIVSSFLDVTGKSDDEDSSNNSKTNKAILSAEVSNSYVSEENRKKYEEMGIDLGSINYSDEDLTARYETDLDPSSESITLEVGTINDFFLGVFTPEKKQEDQ